MRIATLNPGDRIEINLGGCWQFEARVEAVDDDLVHFTPEVESIRHRVCTRHEVVRKLPASTPAR